MKISPNSWTPTVAKTKGIFLRIGRWALTYWLVILAVAIVVSFFIASYRHFIAPPMRMHDDEITMKVTAYCACGKCCGWERTWYGLPIYAYGKLEGKYKLVGQTASGEPAGIGTAAVDTKVFPFGTRFFVPGYGWAIAQDRGGAIGGKHIDLFFRKHQDALNWGVKKVKVKVWYQ